MAQIALTTPYQPRSAATKLVLESYRVNSNGSADITFNLLDVSNNVVENRTVTISSGALTYFTNQAPTVLGFLQTALGSVAAGTIS